MNITDANVLTHLREVCSGELEEMLSDYPEGERDGRSDMQMLADEAGYLYSLYSEEGSGHRDDLVDARRVLRATKNGKVMPLSLPSLAPKFTNSTIRESREIVNHHRRLGNLIKRLEKAGYHSRWL
mgnify:CR=1 FL=1